MKLFIVVTVSLILLVIGLLHFYWAFGGRWGAQAAIPEKYRKSSFNADNTIKFKAATIIVALGLFAFAMIVVSNYIDFSSYLKASYTYYATLGISVIFLLRAMGDFSMVGLFRKKSENIFAKNDAKIYTPLCLFLGISSLWLTFN